MAFKPTKMQQKAIDEKGNILVAAAAGSGKTAVLVERVITELTDPENPISADKLLIVTFTNAAAAEMRGRIEKRLYEECVNNSDNSFLIKQRHLISSADICTIDSFCINIVRQNFEKCGVEPDFKVGDTAGVESASKKALSLVFEEMLDLQNEDTLKLLELVGCEYSDEALRKIITDIYDYSRNMPFPERFVESLKAPYEAPFDSDHPWYMGGFKIAQECIGEMKISIEKMVENAQLMEKVTDADKCDQYTKTLSFMVENLGEKVLVGDWDSFYETLHTSIPGKSPSSSTTDPAALKYKAAKDKFFNFFDKLLLTFKNDTAGIEGEAAELLPKVSILVKLIKGYGKHLKEIFKTENFYTFAEIEQMAFNLLCEDIDGAITVKESAKEWLSRYDEVMVDEFQDVNNLQNILFYILSDHDKKLFVVGDVKQSIYGFRGSNPDNFLSKKNSAVLVENATDSDAKKIILSDNFRSRKGVCEYINFFFSLCMNGKSGKLIYNAEERLNAAREFPENAEPKAKLFLLDKSNAENPKSAIEYEALAIASYIKETMEKPPFITDSDGKTLRKAKYSDFVILLDRIKDKAAVISKILTESGIPVAAISESYAESFEIRLMLSLLQVIDNPKSDVELLTVMMSPLYGFSANEIALIRAENKYTDLYGAVVAYAQKGDAHCNEFIESIADMRRRAAVMPLEELIITLIAQTDMLNLVSAMPSGELKRANLLSLSRYASGYVSSVGGSISGFVRYINELPEKSFKDSSGNTGACVRIMTMHSSKGLQFPICIIANLTAKINRDDALAKTLYKNGAGISFRYYDAQTDSYIKTLGHKVAAEEAYESIIDERLRLLYVAMTRAEEQLVIFSFADNAAKKLAAVADSLDKDSISGTWLKSTTNMNDWVIATALLHPDCEKLRVMAEKSVPTVATESLLELSVLGCEKLDNIAVSEDTVETAPNPQLTAKIKENIDYVYPFDALKKVKSKASVSILAHEGEGHSFAFSEKPAFMFKEGISPAGRGTAMHHIMQFINMDGIPDVKSEMERLLEWQYITPSEASVCDISAIEAFFGSNVYKRISASSDVRREMRFMTEVKASAIDPDLIGEAGDTPVIIQGAVDLCFDEGDGIVVVDFKTDRVQNDMQFINAYKEQLEIYSDACRRIFGKEVKEKIIYSFALKKEITL